MYFDPRGFSLSASRKGTNYTKSSRRHDTRSGSQFDPAFSTPIPPHVHFRLELITTWCNKGDAYFYASCGTRRSPALKVYRITCRFFSFATLAILIFSLFLSLTFHSPLNLIFYAAQRTSRRPYRHNPYKTLSRTLRFSSSLSPITS